MLQGLEYLVRRRIHVARRLRLQSSHTHVRHRSLQSKLKESSSLERELLQAH